MAPASFSRCRATFSVDKLCAPPPFSSSKLTTCRTAFPKTFINVFSIPPFRVAVELEQLPHAPFMRTATIPSSMPNTSTSPPSACRNGRTASKAASTFSMVNGCISRFGSSGVSSGSSLCCDSFSYGDTTFPVVGSTVGAPAAPAPAFDAAVSSFAGHVSGASVHALALIARHPFGIHSSPPSLDDTQSSIHRSASFRRFVLVAICAFANAATRTFAASSPLFAKCDATAARTSRRYPTNVICASPSYVAYTPATAPSPADLASSHAAVFTTASPSSRTL
mmetsp:Transcript_8235/g.27378  ORF Transcript_8235/g.27378 Transcript_8235/m.27378 type:complete len:280 (-) Transcript_8235:231-1070(-)